MPLPRYYRSFFGRVRRGEFAVLSFLSLLLLGGTCAVLLAGESGDALAPVHVVMWAAMIPE